MLQQTKSCRKVHSAGFVVLDLLVADGKITPHVGGTAANVAINLALLGWDASVSALLGDDPAGQFVRNQLEMYKVDTGAVVNDPNVTTPVVIHEVAGTKHRFRFSCPHCGAKYAKFRPLPVALASSAPEADVQFFDRASAYAIEVSRLRREVSALVFEPGSPGRPAATASMVSMSHLFRVSGDLDLPAEAAAAASEKTQVIGLAGDGLKYRTSTDGTWRRKSSHIADGVVDAGGAGDWVTAALLDELEPSDIKSDSVAIGSLDVAVDRALDFAAACCRHLGTRGLVGTTDWLSLMGTGESGSAPVSRLAPAATPGGGCDDWFHSKR